MVSDAIDLCTESVLKVSDWLVQIFDSTSGMSIYLGLLVALLSIRYFLVPVFGRNVGSDIARSHADRKNIDSASYYDSLDSGSSDIMVI